MTLSITSMITLDLSYSILASSDASSPPTSSRSMASTSSYSSLTKRSPASATAAVAMREDFWRRGGSLRNLSYTARTSSTSSWMMHSASMRRWVSMIVVHSSRPPSYAAWYTSTTVMSSRAS